ncbi:hypothetical protein EC988_000768 [Linderina pennispora]|nr:hypothetical protein EC988_000768 [Linderina pennispora]
MIPQPAKQRLSIFSRTPVRTSKTLEQSVAELMKMVDPVSQVAIPRHVELPYTGPWLDSTNAQTNAQLIQIIDIRCLVDMVLLDTFGTVIGHSRRPVGRHILAMSETQRAMRFYAQIAHNFRESIDLHMDQFPAIAHSVVLINNNNVLRGAPQSFEMVGLPDSTTVPTLVDEGAKKASQAQLAERHQEFRRHQIYMRQAMETAQRCADDAYRNCPILVEAMEETKAHVWPLWSYMVDDHMALAEHERKMARRRQSGTLGERHVRFSDENGTAQTEAEASFQQMGEEQLEREVAFRLHTHCLKLLHNGKVPHDHIKLFLHTMLFTVILFNEKVFERYVPRRESKDSAMVDPHSSSMQQRATPIPTMDAAEKSGLVPPVPGGEGQPLMDKEHVWMLMEWSFAKAMGYYLAHRYSKQELDTAVERAKQERYVQSVEVSLAATYQPLNSDDTAFHEMIWQYVRERYDHRKEFSILVIDEAVREYNAILQDIRFKHNLHLH